MTHAQHPIGSGFTAFSTADDVIRGIDLAGKNVIVTGGHGRLGAEVARTLASAGASVTPAARNAENQLDLADPASIDAFAKRWLATGKPLHILINCAVASPAGRQLDARGYEMQFSVGHLGHFQLTLALLPALRAAHGARVVNVSSGAHRMGQIRWDDPGFSTDYAPHAAYGQVKKANVLFTVELDRRGAPDGIRSYAVHPGVIIGTTSTIPKESLRAQGLIDENDQPIIDPARGKKNIEQGASTIVFAATSPLLANIGGVYLKDNDIAPIDDEKRPLTADNIPSDAMTSSLDPVDAKRLWNTSEKMLSRAE